MFVAGSSGITSRKNRFACVNHRCSNSRSVFLVLLIILNKSSLPLSRATFPGQPEPEPEPEPQHHQQHFDTYTKKDDGRLLFE
jgi:hypothetical protein